MPAQTHKDIIVFINRDYPNFINELTEYGFRVIEIDKNATLSGPVCKHADMQIAIVNSRTFVLPGSEQIISYLESENTPYTLTEKASQKYPKDVLCNLKQIGNNIICNTKYIDKSILVFAENSNLNVIHVNQGYAGCSTLKVDDNSIITSDKGIYEAAIKNKIDAIKIHEGFIKLEGLNYGFIGGASCNINNKLIIFFGTLGKHPDKDLIREFIRNKGLNILELNGELTDIGGMVAL